jgi:thioesterase domain-containing protein
VPGTLTVISTKDYELSRAFWEERADRVDWHEIEAPHLTIFQQPHADVLGETLAEVLQESTA